jgi:hypothetical protein
VLEAEHGRVGEIVDTHEFAAEPARERKLIEEVPWEKVVQRYKEVKRRSVAKPSMGISC